MARQEDAHVFSGMQQDMAVSKCPAQYLIDAHNIRITRRDNGTLLTITNEKGTLDTEERFRGVCLGHAVLNNQLVLFTKEEGIESPDRIYKTEFNNGEYITTLLYLGNLNFDLGYPIETLPYYENNLIQKIYWTDNFNLPRLINIALEELKRATWTDISFDFVPELNLLEIVTVEKSSSDASYFKAGTIQYAFSYYNLYGLESNIFYTTKIYYTSLFDRAGGVDQMVSNAFNITISNIDTHFDYVRIYSILRNAQDVSPLVKIVADIKIEKGNRIIDDDRNIKWAHATNGDSFQYSVDNGPFQDIDIDNNNSIVQLFFAGNDRDFIVIDTLGTSDFILRTPDRDLRTEGRYFYIMRNYYRTGSSLDNNSTVRYILAGNGGIEEEGPYHMLADPTDIEFFYKKQDRITLTDNGMHGETIDPFRLLYIGGEEILAYTMSHKDGTLFLGNIKIKRPSIPSEIKDALSSLSSSVVELPNEDPSHPIRSCSGCARQEYQLIKISESPYPYYTGLHINTSGFKHNEYYRLGLLFQYKNGKWSEPCWIGDFKQSETPTLNIDNGILKMPSYYAYIPKYDAGLSSDDLINKIQKTLIDRGYKKVRGVVVVPQKEERTIVCLGVLNPTLYTLKDREDLGAGIYAYNSWFFRAMNKTGCCISDNESTADTTGGGVSPQSRGTLLNIRPWTLYSNTWTRPWFKDRNQHATTEYTGHYKPFRSYAWGKGIEMSYEDEEISSGGKGDYNLNDIWNLFNIDWNFVTINSPELEFTEYFYSADLSGVSVIDVGRIPISRTMADIDITIKDGSAKASTEAVGFVHTSIIGQGAAGIISLPCYNDGVVNDRLKAGMIGNFLCLLWHREGSLNNDMTRDGNTVTERTYAEDSDMSFTESSGMQTAVFEFKKVSNLRISNYTHYCVIPNPSLYNGNFSDTTNRMIFYGDKEPVLEKVNNKLYYGNMDYLAVPRGELGTYFVSSYGEYDYSLWSLLSNKAYEWRTVYPISNKSWYGALYASPSSGESRSAGIYRIVSSNSYNETWPYENTFTSAHILALNLTGQKYEGLVRKKLAGKIRFRSAPHLVVLLDHKYVWNGSQTDPYCMDVNDTWELGDYSMYFSSTMSNLQDMSDENNCAILPMVEVVRLKSPNMFGGNTYEAILKNIWLPAGEAVRLDQNNHIKVNYTEGDTWYQRYDCLKTLAFSKEDKNQVIEILSFMVETHVNLEGRYDRNRGQLSNVNMSSINFNMMNPAYTLLDNFFNYKSLLEDQYELLDFPTQFTWSLQKKIGSEIDDWTNVNMGSSYNVDGKLGSITDLVTWNDKIFCFQEKGISLIMFNSRVLIPTSDNVPIEITNNYKVDGVQYLSDSLGSENKWSVCSTSAALYFIDYTTRDLYAIGGQGINNLAVSKNMSLWFRKLPVGESKPSAYTVRLFHDKQYGDLYILTENESLVFSETLGEFTSFMSYKKLPMLENINNDFYALHSVLSESQSESLERKEGLYKMFAGNYNNFFGEIKPYDLTFVSNGVSNDKNLSTFEKIFTNLEVTTDYWKVKIRDTENKDLSVKDEYPLNKFSFNKIKVWNEYQDTKEVELQRLASPSNLKKKFRLWRIQLPRNKKFDINNNYKITGLIDRIRNPWAKIKLINDNPSTNAMQLHHLNVSYFI